MSALPRKATALVLAGQRDGKVDPLAASAGLVYKALVPVAGRPMIAHVVEALADSSEIGTIVISINAGAALERHPALARLVAEGRVRIEPARAHLVDSVMAALATVQFPVLITTADNVHLTPAAISEFCGGARRRQADVGVAFARRSDVLDAHPDGQRRFYRFADDAYSNCNSYWLDSAAALRAAEVFRSGGQFAKHPLRIAGAFGLLNLIRFRYGIGTLEGLFVRLSRRFRMVMQPVVLSDGAMAIDVDNARTLAVAEDILAWRETLAIAAE